VTGIIHECAERETQSRIMVLISTIINFQSVECFFA
jgi:hypothetical protein